MFICERNLVHCPVDLCYFAEIMQYVYTKDRNIASICYS